MRITRYTDYSLRVLIYLGLKGEGELTTIGEVAERYQISRSHLMKVVQELASKNYVLATRGKGGGLRLNRPAEEINIGALVRDMEQDLGLVECFDSNTACVISPACELKRILKEALDAFLQALDGYSLADLISPAQQGALMQILRLAPSAESGLVNSLQQSASR